MNIDRNGTGAAAIACLALLGGCVSAEADGEVVEMVTSTEQALTVPENPVARVLLGAALFFAPLPDTNGRSCATCPVPYTGFGLTPMDVQLRYWLNPHEPLFRALDADDFASDFTKLREHALIRVSLVLPANVSIEGQPDERVVHVWRGTPTIIDTALTAPYLSDGRAETLAEQAQGAFLGHAEATTMLDDVAFELIGEFERTFFSS